MSIKHGDFIIEKIIKKAKTTDTEIHQSVMSAENEAFNDYTELHQPKNCELPTDLPVIPGYTWEKRSEYRYSCDLYPENQDVAKQFPSNAEFGTFVVRGLDCDIDKAITILYPNLTNKDKMKKTVVDGISEVEVFYDDVLRIMREFPWLKVIGFYEDWSDYSVVLFMSCCDNSGIDYRCKVGSFDPESELNRMAFDISPTSTLQSSYSHIQTGEEMDIDYNFELYFEGFPISWRIGRR